MEFATRFRLVTLWSLVSLLSVAASTEGNQASKAPKGNTTEQGQQLVAAMLAETPLIEDLRSLTDEIGGRPTGSEANGEAVKWALDRFRSAGVWAEREAFEMPARWLERSASATISSLDGSIRFEPRIAAMPYSPGTVLTKQQREEAAEKNRKKRRRAKRAAAKAAEELAQKLEEAEGDTESDTESDTGDDAEKGAEAAELALPDEEIFEPENLTARLVDAGRGQAEDFARLGDSAKGAWALIETDELVDLAGLFAEYAANAELEPRAFAAGVAGVAYIGSRGGNLLYRHNASSGPQTDRPMVVIERDGGLRALRLLRAGHELELKATLDIDSGPAYKSYNVVGEIKGSMEPEEFVVIGAHLDSWGLGTGALDNGCNVALVIDIARQMRKLHIVPKRTIRFVLFNGEEEGLTGSYGYTRLHRNELDRHVMASSFDIGSGKITGFFTNGRQELADATDAALKLVADLGPFAQVNVPVVGTDNYDFMMQGVGNLIANQESANYGPNYHARSDTFDKVDQEQLKENSAIAAALAWGFANMDVTWKRQSREEIEQLVASTDLEQQMRSFGLWETWLDGSRGRELEQEK